MADWLFEVQDRNGNQVHLTRFRWEMHIGVKHSEVAPYLAEIQQVIQSPGIITREQSGTYHLARLGAVGGKWASLYLEVVVRYTTTSSVVTGNVLTVFFNGRPPKGKLQWLTKN